MKSSQAALDLIVSSEVTSEAFYMAKLQGPTWPGGASGVTVGIGYDVGYSTVGQIDLDWADKIPLEMVEALQDVAGIKGSPASSHAHELLGLVVVPWDAAMAVFEGRDMPKWESTVAQALPNTDKLSPDCFGALVSLAYNRGASFGSIGDRYREMGAIRQHMRDLEFDKIPAEFRSMERIWPNSAGLRIRRENEAALFEKGLAEMAVA